MSLPAVEGARDLLSAAGYGSDAIVEDFSVWVDDPMGVVRADLVAFGRTDPKDMSTAVITVGQDRVDRAYLVAQSLAAPYFLLAAERSVDLWVARPREPRKWREDVTASQMIELRAWLRPRAALTAKVGLTQLPLFDVPVDLLADARAKGADRLTPLVSTALRGAVSSLSADDALSAPVGPRQIHKMAARLVVGALTVLVTRDRALDREALRLLDAGALIRHAIVTHPSTFAWWAGAQGREQQVLVALVEQLGRHIDYQGLDPAILSRVYEEALVDDDERTRLGIHYTPPRLAQRLLRELPVETIAPDDRHVLDPCCGSGTLLVAAHDRLRDLQPDEASSNDRHRELAVHLHGADKDPFAVEIARLTLLLHAQPAGNGWRIAERDTLDQPPPQGGVKIVVTNPPWRFSGAGERTQLAERFLRLCMAALAPGGLLGIVLPASWLSARYGASSRRELLSDFDVFETWRLPEGTFARSRVSTTVLLARKRDGNGGQGAHVVREVSSRGLTRFLADDSPGDVFWMAAEEQGFAAAPPQPTVRSRVTSLASVADVLSGQQPLSSIRDGVGATPYLHRFNSVKPYEEVLADSLWHVSFPDDFQTARGASIIAKRKVLTSAARSSNSPWRFRVAVDTRGVAMRNSMRGVAPHRQEDSDLLFALAVILGSGFASAFAAGLGGDRNVPAEALRRLPIPLDRDVIESLGQAGMTAATLAADPSALHAHLVRTEHLVWDAYDVPSVERETAIARLAGHVAPEGRARYPARAHTPRRLRATLRRLGAVLGLDGNTIRIWVNGVTPDDGTWVPFPAGMPGWMARVGATFDVVGLDHIEDIPDARFSFQRMAWEDLDFDSALPAPILPR